MPNPQSIRVLPQGFRRWQLSPRDGVLFCNGWGTKTATPPNPMGDFWISKAFLNSVVSTLTPPRKFVELVS